MPNQTERQADKSGELLRKRKQLSSCDSCRMRRIRCIRDNNNEVCTPCREKAIRCTSDYIQNTPRLNSRSVKRVAAPPSSSSTQHDTQERRHSNAQSSSRRSETSQPKQGAPEVVSVGNDVAGPFGKHLADTFYDCLHHQCPAIQWEPFYQELLVAGYNASEMSTPEGEVLCMVVQAFGARVSDHPFILGSDAPKRDTLPRGADLSMWGRKRKIFCRALLDRAMRAFHARGIIHRVSIRSIGAMVLLFWLWENTDPKALSEPRILTAIALEHMRIMIEKEHEFPPEDIAEIRGGSLFWTIFLGEGAASAHNSRLLQVSTPDILLFAPLVLKNDQPLRIMPVKDPDEFLGNAAFRLFGDLAMIARTVCEQLTGPLARQQNTIDMNVCHSIWESMDAHYKLFEWVQDRMIQLFGSIPSSQEIWMKTLICAAGGFAEVVSMRLQERLANLTGSESAQEIQMFTTLCTEGKRRSFSAVLYLCTALQDRQKHSRVIAFGGTLLSTIGSCIQRLLSELSYEEGGEVTYTLSKKIGCVEVLLDNLKFTAWAWDVGNEIHAAEDRLRTLKMITASAVAHNTLPDPYTGLDEAPFDMFDSFTMPALYTFYPSVFLEDSYRDVEFDVALR